MQRHILACALSAATLCALPARASSNMETAGTYVAIALPLAAGGIAVWQDDWTGVKQLAVVGALTVGTAYGLKHLVRECRPFAHPCGPGGDNWDSFPSDTSALAFAPAQFLWQRYGWQYGVPAYAAAAFVGYSRVDAQKHHFWDVLTSAAISLAYNELITTRYRPHKSLYTAIEASPDGVHMSLNYNW